VLGSLVMGIFVAYFLKQEAAFSQEFRLFVTVGFLGGFTTFSTFSMDALMLSMRGEVTAALLYILSSVVFSLCAVVLGSYLVSRIVA
jgi:CrcB protein